jgi:hypothetical protein
VTAKYTEKYICQMYQSVVFLASGQGI